MKILLTILCSIQLASTSNIITSINNHISRNTHIKNEENDKVRLRLSEYTIKAKIGEKVYIKILNYSDLKNVYVTYKEEEVNVEIKNNIIEIIALKEKEKGNIIFQVNADNAEDERNVIISTSMWGNNHQSSIVVDKYTVNIVLENGIGHDKIKIKNWLHLDFVRVKILDNPVCDFKVDGDIIDLETKKAGKDALIITASNAPTLIIQIFVYPPKQVDSIELDDNGPIDLYLDNEFDKKNIIIKNYKKLYEVGINISNKELANASIDKDGNINIKALKQGEVILNVYAENATNSSFIKINIHKSKNVKKITFDKDNMTLSQGTIDHVSITNFNQLENVKIFADDNFVNTSIDENGMIKITALKQEGSTTMMIIADNVDKPAYFNIKILAKDSLLEVKTDLTEFAITYGETAEIKILNMNEIGHVELSQEGIGLDEYSLNEKTGIISIKASHGGNHGKLIIDAENAKRASIMIHLGQSLNIIQLETYTVTLNKNESKIIKILNSKEIDNELITKLDPKFKELDIKTYKENNVWYIKINGNILANTNVFIQEKDGYLYNYLHITIN